MNEEQNPHSFAAGYGAWRDLVVLLLDDVDGQPFTRVLQPWLAAHPGAAAWLASLRERGRTVVPALGQDELWELYALGRLCELLVFETGGNAVGAPRLAMSELEHFLGRLGIDVLRPVRYTPFHHEVVELVQASDPAQAPQVLGFAWPCLMLGSLLLMRGGVRVAAGSRTLAPGIADASTLYWTYSRPHRPTHDLAHGWGSNSAWRTAFRRDYLLDGQFHWNVDGAADLAQCDRGDVDEYGLTVAERVELLVHRSFVTTEREHADLFPYFDRLSSPAPGSGAGPRLPFWKRLFA